MQRDVRDSNAVLYCNAQWVDILSSCVHPLDGTCKPDERACSSCVLFQ